jgi:hypothetical protein
MTWIFILNGVLMFVVFGTMVAHLGREIVADRRRVEIAEIRRGRRQRTPVPRRAQAGLLLSRELG